MQRATKYIGCRGDLLSTFRFFISSSTGDDMILKRTIMDVRLLDSKEDKTTVSFYVYANHRMFLIKSLWRRLALAASHIRDGRVTDVIDCLASGVLRDRDRDRNKRSANGDGDELCVSHRVYLAYCEDSFKLRIEPKCGLASSSPLKNDRSRVQLKDRHI